MPAIPKTTSRRELHVFYVLDTSGSMEGAPIQILNQTMRETVRAMQKVARGNGDMQLKISVLEFASEVKWMKKDGPEDIDDFTWIDLLAGGFTKMGAAIRELNEKLTQDKFMKSSVGTFLPIIIFMTDGRPTDDYEKELTVIKNNEIFRRASKIGFAVGDYADAEMIAHLTGDSNAVIRTNNLGLFAKLLQFVSVTSSIMGSESQLAGGPISTGGSIVKEVLENMEIPSNEVAPDFNYYDAETVTLESTNIGMQEESEISQIVWKEEDDW